jgi:hypothetical protein
MVPRLIDLSQQEHQFLPIAQDGARNDLIVQTAEESVITGEQAAIEERNIEFGIVAMEAVAIFQRARSGTDLEPQIPKILTKGADVILARCGGQFTVGQKQQIDIRVGSEHAAPIASDG